MNTISTYPSSFLPDGNEFPFECIKGLRLQPLVNLASEEVVAYEVLVLMDEGDTERFFRTLAPVNSLALFFWQAQMVLRQQGHFWLNLPVAIFCDPSLVELLAAYEHQQRLTIEIQDPENLLRQNVMDENVLRHSLIRLRSMGWTIWIDDLTQGLAGNLISRNFHVNGVKIDRRELNANPLFNLLIKAAKRISPHILVEGIECQADLQKAKESHALLGQGYLWPQITLRVSVPLQVTQHARDLFLKNKQQSAQQIAVYIACRDRFYAQGLSQIIWSLMSDPFRPYLGSGVTMVDDEAFANVIIRESFPGETPRNYDYFQCSASLRNVGVRKSYVIIDNGEQHSFIRQCPGVSAFLSRRDTVAHTEAVLRHVLKLSKDNMLTGVQHPNSFCAACRKLSLTINEKKVLAHIGAGDSISHVALQLGCTIKAVSRHKRAMMSKLYLNNNIEFYQYASWIAGIKYKRI